MHFLSSWEKLTKDQNILQIVMGYRILFLCRAKQKREPKDINFSMQGKATISIEVENLLQDGCCGTSLFTKAQFMSIIFIVKRKDGGNRPVINLKGLNQYIPFIHFKMETLQSLKTFLQKKTNTCANQTSGMHIYLSHFLRTTKRV